MENSIDKNNLQEMYHYSFEEFKLMYESTEKISDRKINFNQSNSSLCIAIIAGQGVSASWVYKTPDIAFMASVVMVLISFLSAIFCMYWAGKLYGFNDLNTAKFKVLEEMVPHVIFPDYKERTIRSSNPFVREYQILNEQKRLTAMRGALTLKSNFAETIVPKGFLSFFVLAGIFSIYWAAHSMKFI